MHASSCAFVKETNVEVKNIKIFNDPMIQLYNCNVLQICRLHVASMMLTCHKGNPYKTHILIEITELFKQLFRLFIFENAFHLNK